MPASLRHPRLLTFLGAFAALALVTSVAGAQHSTKPVTSTKRTSSTKSTRPDQPMAVVGPCDPADPGCDSTGMPANTPPSIFFDVQGTETDQNRTTTITYCDDWGLSGGWSVILDGVDHTNDLGYVKNPTNWPGCNYAWYARLPFGSYTPGTHTLTSSICDVRVVNADPQGPFCTTASKTIKARNVEVSPDNNTVHRAPATTYQTPFTVKDFGDTAWFRLSVACTGVTGCRASSDSVKLRYQGDSAVVLVTYTTGAVNSTGRVTLKATWSKNTTVADTGTTAVAVDYGDRITLNTDFTSTRTMRAALCANNCFDATAAVSTVPYYSGDAPQSVRLEYRNETVRPRPFIYADLTLGKDYPNVDKFTMEVLDPARSNAKITFLNGEPTLRFAGGQVLSGPVRIGGQFDAASNGYPDTTRVVPLKMVITTTFVGEAGRSEVDTTTIYVPIVNRAKSAIGIGWEVAGLQHLYKEANGDIVITEGSSSATSFPVNPGVGYYTPANEYTTLTMTVTGVTQTWTRTYPDGTKAMFNSLGQLTNITDRFNGNTFFAYDSFGRLEKLYDPVRNTYYTQFFYGSKGLDSLRALNSTAGVVGDRVSKILHDSAGRLTSFQDPDGGITRFGYDASGRLGSTTDRRGQTSTIGYAADQSNRIATLSSPVVNVMVNGVAKDTALVTRLQSWQTAGIATSATAITPATPALIGSIAATITDPAGHVTRITTERYGRPVTVTDPVANVTSYQYDGIFPKLVKYPNGDSESWTYTNGLLTDRSPVDGGGGRYSYGAFAQLVQIITSSGTTDFYLNPLGLPDSAKAPGGTLTTRYTYDSMWRLIQYNDAGHVTVYSYDAITGNRDSVTTPEGRGSKTLFDKYGRAWIVRAAGKADTTTYDAINRVVSVKDGVNPAPTRYEYDGLLRTVVVDPKGQRYRVDYNAVGWPTRRYDPFYNSTDSASAKYLASTYDLDGNVAVATNRRNQPVTMTYDAIGRVTRKTDGGALDDRYDYTPNGGRVVASNAVSVDTIFPRAGGGAALGANITVYNGKWFDREYRYWAGGALWRNNISTSANIDFQWRQWDYTNGQLDSVIYGLMSARLNRGGDGRVNGVSLPYAYLKRTVTQSNDGTITGVSYNSASYDSAFARTYTYDSIGRLSTESRKLGQSPEHLVYTYDRLDRLASWKRDHLVNGAYWTDESYGLGYDEASNLRQTTAPITDGSYTTGNRQMTWWPNSYTYDSDGNRSTRVGIDGVTTYYNWDALGRLTSVTVSGQTIYFDYNALGELVRRRLPDASHNRYYLWDQGNLTAVLSGDASKRIAEYMYNGTDRPLVATFGDPGSSRTYWFESDTKGNVTGMFDGTGPKAGIVYDPWGNVTQMVQRVADTTDLRWKGLLWQGEIAKLYYVRARWYDPEARRFISEDPLGISGGVNQYAFAGGDPVNGRDPSGLLMTAKESVLGGTDPWDDAESAAKKQCPKGTAFVQWDVNGYDGTGDTFTFWCRSKEGYVTKTVRVKSPELQKKLQNLPGNPQSSAAATPAQPSQTRATTSLNWGKCIREHVHIAITEGTTVVAAAGAAFAPPPLDLLGVAASLSAGGVALDHEVDSAIEACGFAFMPGAPIPYLLTR